MFVHYTSHNIDIDLLPLAHPAIVARAPWCDTFEPGTRVLVVRPSGMAEVLVVESSRPTNFADPGTDQLGQLGQLDRRRRHSRSSDWTPAAPDATEAHDRLIDETVTWAGRSFSYRLDPTGFWQVHREAPAVLVEAVLATVGDLAGQTVLDLYTGAGLLAWPLALSARRLVALEGDQRAALWAAYNLRQVSQAKVVQGQVRRLLAGDAAVVPRRADVVVLDPPRSGAGPRVLDGVIARQPHTIVYLACDPAALARDLADLVADGYHLAELRAFDLFPHTHHVECLATLRR